ncbi:hypothetical protein [Paraburkholderia sp. BCC1884]|uniref:hypothetical protein n=1 Tax=Paraburkholderia sp. BCC1884 TaxID=2562668 RepID=UPI0011827446|nr:hypothetical protein [Paraburkholderia sp. BCC1884]
MKAVANACFQHTPKSMQVNENFPASSVIVCKLIEKYPQSLKYAQRRSDIPYMGYPFCAGCRRAANGGALAAAPKGQTAHPVPAYRAAK